MTKMNASCCSTNVSCWPLFLLFFLFRDLRAFFARLREPDSDRLLAALDLVLARFFVVHLRAHFLAGFLAVLALRLRLLLGWHTFSLSFETLAGISRVALTV